MSSQDVATWILVGFGVFLMAGAAYSSHKVKQIDRRLEASRSVREPPAE